MKAKIPLIAALILLIVFLLAFTKREEVSIVAAGSTSVQPYMEVLAEAYALLYPDRVIDVQGGGSSAGIMAVESGIAQIGMSSRSLKESESHLWKTEIAKDGLAIVVNPKNPIGGLTGEQLKRIYTGSIANWSELGGADARIHVIAREEGSGTRSAFEDLVMEGHRIIPRAIVQNSNGAVRQLVADDPYSIGFISLGLVETGERPVKAVAIDGIAAARDNVMNASYALYRPFWLVTAIEPEADSPAALFLEFISSSEGHRILTAEGLVVTEG